jgi:hypothetical protein
MSKMKIKTNIHEASIIGFLTLMLISYTKLVYSTETILPQLVNTPITDYAQIHKSKSLYYEIEINNETDALTAIKKASLEHIPVRFRGAGHSMNGFSLPMNNELLLRSNKLRDYAFEEDGTITVGSGITIWEIDAFLKTIGFTLPVKNGGWSGPTVGGYISAGGVGEIGLKAPGTFAKHVISVDLIDGMGELRVFKKSDSIFNWLFGSMGQLGFITKAKLEILKIPDRKEVYPLGQVGIIPILTKVELPRTHYWFILMCPKNKLDFSLNFIKSISKKFSTHLVDSGITVKTIDNKDTFLPLLYPEKGDFYFITLYGSVSDVSPQLGQTIGTMEKEIMAFSIKNRIRRYAQTEYLPIHTNFKKYFGGAIYNKFLNVKKTLDPKMIFSQHSVFP